MSGPYVGELLNKSTLSSLSLTLSHPSGSYSVFIASLSRSCDVSFSCQAKPPPRPRSILDVKHVRRGQRVDGAPRDDRPLARRMDVGRRGAVHHLAAQLLAVHHARPQHLAPHAGVPSAQEIRPRRGDQQVGREREADDRAVAAAALADAHRPQLVDAIERPRVPQRDDVAVAGAAAVAVRARAAEQILRQDPQPRRLARARREERQRLACGRVNVLDVAAFAADEPAARVGLRRADGGDQPPVAQLPPSAGSGRSAAPSHR